jgi:threonine dehydratase
MAALGVPDLADVLAARQRIAPYLQPTALYRYPALEAVTGTRTWVKHENHQPVGAFKVRGGVNLIGQLAADERRRGVIAASTGNHGQSVAYAADLFGVRAMMPPAGSATSTPGTSRSSSRAWPPAPWRSCWPGPISR